MSSDTEKYHYFKVGLLKDSFALETLWQDALRYHMIDQPAKLIAMRLTEYYELTNKSAMPSRATMHQPTTILPMFTDTEDAETPTSSTPVIRPPVTSNPTVHPPVARPVEHLSKPSALNTQLANPANNPPSDVHQGDETSLTVSAEVDQNAEEAADYWSLL